MKLTIIIPVYNVEKYIRKCLLSCVNQDLSSEDYEIIVVNDGSPDNSLDIVENIASNYSNIRIINQENQGLSGARNTGLKYAQGEYIWFIDSDDYIEENCLRRIVSFLKDDLDILQLQSRYVYEDDTPSLDIQFCNINGIKTGLEVTAQGGLPTPAPFSIFSTKFLKENNLSFLIGIYHEDCEFKPRATYLAKKIASDFVVSYNYLQRKSGSITSQFKLKNGLDLLKVINSLLKFADDNDMPFQYRKHLYRKISMNMNSLLYGAQFMSHGDKLLLLNHVELNKHIFSCMVHSGNLKYQIEGLLFNLNVKMGLFFYSLIRK